MSFINKFLRNQGVATPYKDDRTSAQIDEANKANPLAGYGFMSAAQKKQRDMQIKLFEEQQRREQEQLQSQLIARMSSQEKIGHFAGQGLFGLVDQLKGKGQAPEVPEAPPTNDPELDRFHQLAQEVGQEGALEIIGRETGNSAMIEQAQQMRLAKQKEGLEMRNMESLIKDREKSEAKPNTVITTQRTGPDGRPMQVSMEVVGKDKDGRNIYKELGEAVKGSLTVDDPTKFGTNKAGVNKRTEDMENMLMGTANAMDSYDLLGKLVKETPAGGWAGALVSKGEDIVSGVKNLSTLLAQAEDAPNISKDLEDYDFSKMEKFAGGAAKIKSVVLELAYARALASERGGKTLSEGDVQRALDQIGGSISNPKIFGELMEQNKKQMIKKLENFGEMVMVDGKSIGEAPQYKAKISKLRERAGMLPKGSTVKMYRNNKTYNIPEDQVEAFKAAGGSESQ
jgi:ribosomal protein S28E/S33